MEDSRETQIEILSGEGKLSELKELLGSEYNQKEIDIALDSAISYSKVDVANYLLDIGANFSEDQWESTINCVVNNQIEGLEIALKHGLNINHNKGVLLNEAIVTAYNEKDTKVLRFLIENGANKTLIKNDILNSFQTDEILNLVYRTYKIILDGKVIGQTRLEKADAPMGVVFGKIINDNNLITYEYLKNYCLNNEIELAEIDSNQKFVITRTIENLRIISAENIEIKGNGNQITGSNDEGFEISIKGVPYPFFEEEFPHHVDEYGKMFDIKQTDSIEPLKHATESKIKKIIGGKYSLLKRLKLGGIGSMKLIHTAGLDFVDQFNSKSQSLDYLSFELRPNGLVGRTHGNNSRTFVLLKNDIQYVRFKTYKIKISTRSGIVVRNEALIEFKLKNGTLNLYLPSSSYSAVKSFFSKDWLNNKTRFFISKKDPEIVSKTEVIEILAQLLKVYR